MCVFFLLLFSFIYDVLNYLSSFLLISFCPLFFLSLFSFFFVLFSLFSSFLSFLLFLFFCLSFDFFFFSFFDRSVFVSRCFGFPLVLLLSVNSCVCLALHPYIFLSFCLSVIVTMFLLLMFFFLFFCPG